MIVSECEQGPVTLPAETVDEFRKSLEPWFLRLSNGYLELTTYVVTVKKQGDRTCKVYITTKPVGAGDSLYIDFCRKNTPLATEMLVQRLQSENPDLTRREALEKAGLIIKRVIS